MRDPVRVAFATVVLMLHMGEWMDVVLREARMGNGARRWLPWVKVLWRWSRYHSAHLTKDISSVHELCVWQWPRLVLLRDLECVDSGVDAHEGAGSPGANKEASRYFRVEQGQRGGLYSSRSSGEAQGLGGVVRHGE